MKYNQLGNGSALKELYVTDDIEMYNDQIETKSFDINWPLIYTINTHNTDICFNINLNHI